jgi:hypothetical protein
VQVGYYLDTANSTKLHRVVIDTATGQVRRWAPAAGGSQTCPALPRLARCPPAPPPPAALPCPAPPQVTRQLLGQRGCEFPSINPALTGRPHTHIYTTAGVAGGFPPRLLSLAGLPLLALLRGAAPLPVCAAH